MRRGVLAGLLCLGVLTATGGARAAACPSGPGFVAVPGSDTCLRLSGRVAAGVAASRRGPAEPRAVPKPRAAPEAEGRLSVDARTATEAGPVRAFVRMGAGQRRTGPFP